MARGSKAGSAPRAGRAAPGAAASAGGEAWLASLEAAATISAQPEPRRMPSKFISIATMPLGVSAGWLLTSSGSANLSKVEGGADSISVQREDTSMDTIRDESK
jgi:hypothetical protein